MSRIIKDEVLFHWPKAATTIHNPVKEVSSSVPNGTYGYAGFSTKTRLEHYLTSRFAKAEPNGLKPLTAGEKRKIESASMKLLALCKGKVSLNEKIEIHVFPWLDESAHDNAFNGVTGYTPFRNTVHLFISPSRYQMDALRETLAHELCHAFFLLMRPAPQRLIDTMIFEGLADLFCGEVMGGTVLPWARALSVPERKRTVRKLAGKVRSSSYALYVEVFFGSKNFKRWSGYSIGYHMARSFRDANPDMPWRDILRLRASKIAAYIG